MKRRSRATGRRSRSMRRRLRDERMLGSMFGALNALGVVEVNPRKLLAACRRLFEDATDAETDVRVRELQAGFDFAARVETTGLPMPTAGESCRPRGGASGFGSPRGPRRGDLRQPSPDSGTKWACPSAKAREATSTPIPTSPPASFPRSRRRSTTCRAGVGCCPPSTPHAAPDAERAGADARTVPWPPACGPRRCSSSAVWLLPRGAGAPRKGFA